MPISFRYMFEVKDLTQTLKSMENNIKNSNPQTT